MKIEKKQLSKIVEFLQGLSMFKGQTKSAVAKFSYFLKKVKLKRPQTLYKEGAAADKIYIVKKGELKIVKAMPRDLSYQTSEVVELFGYKPVKQNIFNQKLTEIRDVPMNLNFMYVGRGSLVGEEDVISKEKYSCTVSCNSLKATIYAISKENFMTLRRADDCWMNILEKALWKEHRKRGDHFIQPTRLLLQVFEE